MRVNDLPPAAAPPVADINVVTDAPPPPPEMPPEVHAAFSLSQLLDRSVKTLNRNLENMLKVQPNATKTAEQLAGGAAEQAMAEFMEFVQAKRVRRQMWAQQLRVVGSVVNLCHDALPEEKRSQSLNELLRILNEQSGRPADDFDADVKSSNEFFDKLLDLINLIKNGYLAGYEHIIEAYSEFFKDFNAEITAKLKDWIEGANDGKEVKLNAGALRAALDNLLKKYTHPSPASVLFPRPGQGGTSREEAEKWREALGLPPACLKQNADGTYCVVIDTGPLHTMRSSVAAGGTVTWDTARFQAWQTGFNAQEERMKNMLQSFTQKYSNANSYHDNFYKTLTSHLNQFSDMLKAMLNF